jgi:UDP:flavonoid glycosyltransferase YjiC (YdhE family)
MRVLVSATPGEGHVRPLLPLARALAARGHDVVFATAPAWAARLGELGFAVLPAGLDHAAARSFIDRAQLRELPPGEVRLFLFPRIFGGGHAPAKLADLLARAREWRPDAVVHESADLAAPVAAAALGIPAVNHSFGAMLPLRVLERAAEVVAPLWREQGLDPDPHAGAFRGLYVDLWPPPLAQSEPLGPSVRLRPAERAAAPAPPPEGVETPFVYATMGTIWNEPTAFRVLLDALAGLPAVLTTGRGVTVPGPLPGGVLVAEFLPQDEVLPHARAVVSHGGSGTMLGALAHGLPLVLLPQGADQFDNAAACVEAGAALALLPGGVDAASVRAALERVLAEPSFAAAARRVAAAIAEMGSPEEVARAVEDHLARG